MVSTEINGSSPPTVQLIDQDCNFNDEISSYIRDTNLEGFDYHLVAVFGSQSTGKSTLLNRLFGTSFAVMNEAQRKQTTKGIWLSKSRTSPILIMDVEGTDSRERGDQQDFERRAALFSLAISEVVIVNLFENQVGLYQGANIGLLKTVFEVNLQLFQSARGTKERCLLLFVIRDHLGATPLSNLADTLQKDLFAIWSSLAKPTGLENCKIEDYFDFRFTALPHGILQASEFNVQVDSLRNRFTDAQDPEYVFHATYHKRIPVDGIPHYAKQCWEQIIQNKDLDLPTQQVLLAQYRCDEIASAALEQFDIIIKPLERQVRSDTIIVELGVNMQKAREGVLSDFETQAQRYHKETFNKKLEELKGVVDVRLFALFRAQLIALHSVCVKRFGEEVHGKLKDGGEFAKTVVTVKQEVLEYFDTEAKSVTLEGTGWSYDKDREVLVGDIDELAGRLRKEQLNKVLERLEKQTKVELDDPVSLAFAKPNVEIWDNVMEEFNKIKTEKVETFKETAKKELGATEENINEIVEALNVKLWLALRARLDEKTEPTVLLSRLREFFEDRFKYDEQGVPRIWKPSDDIETLFKQARESTLELIPIFSEITLHKTGSHPSLDIPPPADYTEKSFFTLLSPAKQTDLTARFKRIADTLFLDAKNSTISSLSHIPPWFYVLLLVLGWNELMAVLRNPLLFLLVLLIGGGAFVVVQAGLLGPLMKVGNAVFDQSVEIARDSLRNFVHPPDQMVLNTPVSRFRTDARSEADTIVMDDLDGDGKRKGWKNEE